MLNFFREHARAIGWTIVVTFSVTMFAGAFFYNTNTKSQRQQVERFEQLQQAIAVVGDVPVNAGIYQDLAGQFFSMFTRQYQGGIVPPEVIEIARLRAYNKALEFSLFLDKAEKEGITVSRAELNSHVKNSLSSYGVETEKELKNMLKEANIPYSAFTTRIEQNILAEKAKEQLIQSVNITDTDIDNYFKRLKLAHIFVEFDAASGESKLLAKKQIEAAFADISSNNVTFENAVKKHSQDIESKTKGGQISGYIKYGQLHPDLEAVAFMLPEKGFSQPVASDKGYHILKVVDIAYDSKPKDFDKQKFRQEKTEERRANIVDQYIQAKLSQSSYIIRDPFIQAVVSKFEGDYQTALDSYQKQVAADPNTPLPHYFMGQIWKILGNSQQSLDEFSKGKIKGKLYPNLDFPGLHIELSGAVAMEAYKNKQLKKSVQAKIDRYSKNQPASVQLVLSEIGNGYKEPQVPQNIVEPVQYALKLANRDVNGLNMVKEIAQLLQLNSVVKTIDDTLAKVEAERQAALKKEKEARETQAGQNN